MGSWDADPLSLVGVVYIALFVAVLFKVRRPPTRRTAVVGAHISPVQGAHPASDQLLVAGVWRTALTTAAWLGMAVAFAVAMMLAILAGGKTTHALASGDTSNRSAWNASTTSQCSLANSDGSTWKQVDQNCTPSSQNLSVQITPTTSSTAVLTANASLFTSVAGYNQDLAICVNPSTAASCTATGASVVVWKEAGGYTAYKPAAVYAQAAYPMTAGTTYTVALFWKTNQTGTDKIFTGAGGPAPFSPTVLSAVLTPQSENRTYPAQEPSSALQYQTSMTTWQTVDNTSGSPLQSSFTAATNETALVTVNADVFTGTSGTNQDLGICVESGTSSVTDNCSSGTVLSWVESAGSTSVDMPIAALAQGTQSLTSGTQYAFAAIWRAGASHTIFAGAGSGGNHSLSTLVIQLVPTGDSELATWRTTGQTVRSESGSDNGTTWQPMTSSSSFTYTPSANGLLYAGGNASVFANPGGYNVDLGVCLATTGSCTTQAWAESGQATSFAPDANFVSTPLALTAGTAYTVKLVWRTNTAMSSGNAMASGAGGGPSYSTSSLNGLFVPYAVPSAPTGVTARAVANTDSDGRAVVSWTAPASSIGSPVSQYTVTPYVGTTPQTSLVQTVTAWNSLGIVATSAGVPGLTKGTPYSFQVTATNGAGQGAAASSPVVTPSAPPSYTIAGTGGTTSSPVVTAPAKGFDVGKASQDGTKPQQVVLGQVLGSGAGWSDVLTANGSGANAGDSISVLKNLRSTSGSFSQPATTTAPGESADDIALGDLNGDGKVDIVVVSGTSTVTVLKGNNDGTFSSMSSYTLATNETANYVKLSDLNADGKLDIIVAGQQTDACIGNGETAVATLLGNGDGTFQSPTEYTTGDCGNGFNNYASETTGLAVADINGDGRPDVIWTTDSSFDNGGDGGNLDFRLDSASGALGAMTTAGTADGMGSSDGNSLVVGDFNGDSINDIAVITNDTCCGSDAKRGITVFINSGTASFVSAFYRDPALEDASHNDYGSDTGIALADLNGDGEPDIVTSDNDSISHVGGVSVYLNTGTSSGLDFPVFIPTPNFSPMGIALGDVNNDGKTDIVVEDNATTSPSSPANVEVLVNGTDFPPLGSALGPNELHGCLACQAMAAGGAVDVNGDPVTTNSGEFSQTLTDISLPARGYPLRATQTYNSLNAGSAAVDEGLGYGWSSPLLMTVTQSSATGLTTVTQEDGAQAQFWTGTGSGSLTAVAPRTQATLATNGSCGSSSWTYIRYATNTFCFSSTTGEVSSLTDATGDSLTYGYCTSTQVTAGQCNTVSTQVTSVTHSDGRSLAVYWTGSDISAIKDTNVSGQTRSVSFTYGTGSHAHELTQVDWTATPGSTDLQEAFTYDETTWVHGLASMTDPDGHVVQQTYNSDGTTATQTVDPGGTGHLDRTTTYSYLPARTSTYQAISAALIQDPAGDQAVDQFAYGELVQKISGLTGCSTSSWANGFPTGCSTSDEAVVTSSYDPTSIGTTLTVDADLNTSTASYDSLGNVLSKTDGAGDTTTWDYSGNGGTDGKNYQPTSTTDADGTSTTYYTYDTTHRTLTQTCTALQGGSCSGTPTDANVVIYTHSSTHPADVTAVENGDHLTTQYSYDSYGDLVQTEDAMATPDVSATQYNADGWPVASWTPKAGCTFGSAPPSGCSSTYETTYSHADSSGNLNFWGATTSTTDPLGHVTKQTYDADNNVTTTVDANTNPTQTEYDLAGEVCWVLPGATQSSPSCSSPPTDARVTDYTADGLVADQKDGSGNTIQTFAYNSLNQACWNLAGASSNSCTSAPTGATAFTYDSNGNQLTATDGSGNVTTSTYDAAGRLCWYDYGAPSNPTCGTVPSGADSFTYDADGQRLTMTDATGTANSTYDYLHRLTFSGESQGTGNGNALVDYKYNFRNEVTQLTYPNSQVVNIGYDNAGRETSVQDWNGNTTTFNYDTNSNQTTTVFPTGSCTGTVSLCDTWTYNAADQVTGINDLKSSGTTVFAATYTRDQDGQVAGDTSAPSGQACDTYDSLSRLTAAESGTPPSSCTSGSTPESFAYDNSDNLTTFGATQQKFSATDQLCWTLTGSTSSNACGTVPTGATADYYTGTGSNGGANRTGTAPAAGSATCYAYDFGNHLISIQSGTWSSSSSDCSSATLTATYLSNGDGLRMSKKVGSTTTTAAWDLSGSLPLQITDGSTSYVYGPSGQVLEQITGTTSLWYHHDQIGSTRAISDGSGNVQATYTYDPYGNVVSSTNPGGVTNPFMFQGQYKDSESGMYYLRARYYDPGTGQFLSRDPVVAATHSPYGYVGANPLNATDPSGLYCRPGSFAPGGFAGWLGQGLYPVLCGSNDRSGAGNEGLSQSPYVVCDIDSSCTYFSSVACDRDVRFNPVAPPAAVIPPLGTPRNTAGLERLYPVAFGPLNLIVGVYPTGCLGDGCDQPPGYVSPIDESPDTGADLDYADQLREAFGWL